MGLLPLGIPRRVSTKLSLLSSHHHHHPQDIFVRLCLAILGLLRPWLLASHSHQEVEMTARKLQKTDFSRGYNVDSGKQTNILQTCNSTGISFIKLFGNGLSKYF